MQLPQPQKLAPPRSRPLVLNITFSFFITLWICLQPYHLVHATEIPVPPEHAHHNDIDQTLPHAPLQAPPIDTNGPTTQERGLEEAGYAPDFTYFDRSLIGRQEVEVVKLENNKNKTGELSAKASSFFVFEKGTGARKREASVLSDPSSNSPGTKNTSAGSDSEDTLEEAGLDQEDELEGVSSQDSLGKRQAAGRQIWISANTCKQPGITAKISENGPPQLNLYVSSSEQKPGPDTPRERLIADPIQFEGGFANFTTQTDDDLFVGVAAPDLVPGFEGSWSFEVAASLDGFYHNYLARDYLYMVDTDSDSAVFVTVNLSKSNNTEEFEKIKNNMPFTMYTFSTQNATQHWGLEHSYCGLQNLFNSANNISVDTTFTTKFGGGQPKAQFNVQGLKTNAQYTGFLAIGGGEGDLQLPLWAPNNIDVERFSTIRQGGQVFAMWNWTTKADDSCQVISDLPFCDKVAYAVPSSPKFKTDDAGLMALYDDLAKEYYKNFTNSLDQVACETASTAQYSLARTCDDCRSDYKDWLCSVVFPRCEDYSAEEPWLHPRNIGKPLANGSLPVFNDLNLRERFAYTQSRVPMIDKMIEPGPYKELLPCDYLCHNIVRSCPAALKFACPEGDALRAAYGVGHDSRDNLTCNFPGAVKRLNRFVGVSASMVRVNLVGVVLVAALVGFVGVF